MPTWSEPPLKALWTASTISQTLSMPLTASLVNRPSSSMLSCARSPPIWSRCAPNAANLALENVAQKTINYLPNLAKKCIPHHTETGRKRNPKCALTSCHSGLSSILVLAPALEQPELGTLKRLEHECSLRDELDPEWAVRPIGIARYWDRLVLILEDPGGVPLNELLGDHSAARQEPRPTDPGGEPLDQFLEPMELARFCRLAIGLAAGLSKLHGRGLIHKDIKPANILADPVTNKARFTGFGISSRLA